VRSVEQAPPVANRVEQRLHFARLRHVERHQQRGPEFAGSASPVKALFVGTSAEFGNVWSLDSPISAGPLKQSYSFFTSRRRRSRRSMSVSLSRPAGGAISTSSLAGPTERLRRPGQAGA